MPDSRSDDSGPRPPNGTKAQPRSFLETTATVLLTLCAVAVASVYIYGELSDRPASPRTTVGSEMDNWQEQAALGIRIGPGDARMVIIEFMDFNCPYCAAVVPAVDSLLAQYPAEAALVFQHFPLSDRSLPSAVAVECAERQGQFHPMYRLLFAEQQQLGSKDWRTFAEEAGVQDIAAFDACTALPADSFPRIDAGSGLGRRWNVGGTPTLFVNGRLFGGRTFQDLKRFADDLGLESPNQPPPE